MRKHAFLVRWRREGRVSTPVVDAYASCVWPLGPEDTDVLSAKALVAMVGRENLPDEVKKFMHAYFCMSLRLRYNSGDVSGPYMVNDDEEFLTEPLLAEWVSSVTDEELARYHVNNGRLNRVHKGGTGRGR